MRDHERLQCLLACNVQSSDGRRWQQPLELGLAKSCWPRGISHPSQSSLYSSFPLWWWSTSCNDAAAAANDDDDDDRYVTSARFSFDWWPDLLTYTIAGTVHHRRRLLFTTTTTQQVHPNYAAATHCIQQLEQLLNLTRRTYGEASRKKKENASLHC